MAGSKMKAFFRVGFVVAVTALAWFSIPAAVIAIVACILAALQAKAGTLIEISFGPLKAKLEREVTEAEQLVKQLRQFAALQAKAIVAAGVRTGRWSSESDWLYHHVKDLEAALREMGVSDEALKESRREFVTYAINDAGAMAIGQGQVPMKDGQYLEEEWRAALGEFPHRNADTIEAFLTRHGLMSDERAVRIADMRWMAQHGDVRDAEQYLRAQIPVPW
jgi:hypothetical protein